MFVGEYNLDGVKLETELNPVAIYAQCEVQIAKLKKANFVISLFLLIM